MQFYLPQITLVFGYNLYAHISTKSKFTNMNDFCQ